MSDAVAGLDDQALAWLLEQDAENPGARYLALRDVVGADGRTLAQAQAEVMRSGPVPAILDAQAPEGYWVKPGAGYTPKYTGSTWSVFFLAQLGADGRDERVRRGCEYVLAHSRAEQGGFAIDARVGTSIPCLWGNLVWALIALGYAKDERLHQSAEMLARSITGDGYASWYRKGGVQAPGCYCSGNYSLPCAWGAVRALWALSALPASSRSPVIEAGIEAGVAFLLGHDPAVADYPYQDRVSSRWFQFHYPLGYVTDMLLNLEALAQAGVGHDPRLQGALAMVRAKQDAQGRWAMEHTYNGKMWYDVERRGEPSKWVTLRALRLLKTLAQQASS